MKSASQAQRPRTPGGRPPLTPVALRFPEPMVEEIDSIAERRLDGANRSTVIRELLVEALAARKHAGERA